MQLLPIIFLTLQISRTFRSEENFGPPDLARTRKLKEKKSLFGIILAKELFMKEMPLQAELSAQRQFQDPLTV